MVSVRCQQDHHAIFHRLRLAAIELAMQNSSALILVEDERASYSLAMVPINTLVGLELVNSVKCM